MSFIHLGTKCTDLLCDVRFSRKLTKHSVVTEYVLIQGNVKRPKRLTNSVLQFFTEATIATISTITNKYIRKYIHK